MVNKIILLGAPGSGKGTQSKFLTKDYGFEHIATGDLLRSEVSTKTDLGKEAKKYMDTGILVPDIIVNQMVVNKLKNLKSGRFVLDGFPRTINQAQFLQDNGIELDLVIYFNISLVTLLDRMTGRVTCKHCGASYHIKYNPPKAKDVCDKCGHRELYIREDDNAETFKKRYVTFLNQTQPLLEFYNHLGIVVEIDAEQDITMIEEAIRSRVPS